MTLFKHCNVKFSIFDCLKEKYGTIAQVFYTKLIEKKNQNLANYSEWLDKNTELGFLSRFTFTSLIQYIFLDVNQDDSILSCGLNNPNVCEIISERLKDGYIFINEEDEKIAKSKYNFKFPNYCVISYSILKIPFIQEFDKVLCIVPSTNYNDDDTEESIENGKLTIGELQRSVINILDYLLKEVLQ